MTDKKNSHCGCGCLPKPKKGAKIQKPEVQNPEKSKN
jgi:hypothetical protein